MIDENQKKIKYEGIAETIKYTNDKNDRKYAEFIKKGDLASAKKMVETKAKDKGYTVKAYHGTDAKFTVFDSSKKRTKVLNFGKGFYFGTNKDKAKMYSETGNIIDAYLSMKKPYEIFSYRLDKFDLDRLSNEFSEKVTVDNIQEVLKKNGYDGIIARNYNGTTNPINQYVVFDPNQIKSAEPVVYDDDGNVIPLSQRFDESQDDIRFSISDTQNMSWEKQINSLLQGKKTIKHSDTLVLNNNTPKYLVENGVGDLPLAVPISIITKSKSGKDESHSISDINIVNLKNAIENPIAVINDIGRNSLLFVTNLKQNNGNIVVTFKKSTLFDGDRVHKATSIHSREDMTEYFNNLNNSEIYSLNENKLTVVSGSSIDLERLKQNNKFTKIKIPQQNEFVKGQLSVSDDFDNLVDTYGAIDTGMKPDRDIKVPKRTSENQFTSYVARSIMEKGSVDDATLEQIKEQVVNEALSHKRWSDKEALDYAQKQLKDGEAQQIWNDVVSGKTLLDKNKIAVAEGLLEMYANDGQADKVLTLTAELCEAGTRAGQAVQAFSLLKNMGGVGRLYYLQKVTDSINRDIEKKFGKNKKIPKPL